VRRAVAGRSEGVVVSSKNLSSRPEPSLRLRRAEGSRGTRFPACQKRVSRLRKMARQRALLLLEMTRLCVVNRNCGMPTFNT